jgi:multisubunit Na+/H+ antiporter MnhB subunit
MKGKINWIRIIYIIGVIALIIGAIDPLEGSVVIAGGSVLISFSTYLTKNRHWKLFLILSIAIVFGVFFLFFFSWLGGFGGKSTLSWWWGTLILPYPVAWLTTIVLLIIRAFKRPKPQSAI